MVQIEILKKVHSADIKDGVVWKEYLCTGGRDRTIKITKISNLETVWASEDLGAVVNSLAEKENRIYAGLQTGEIVLYDIIEEKSGEKSGERAYLKQISRRKIHSGNVCSISVYSEGVISTSWDNTVGIFSQEDKLEIVSLESAAWSAKEITGKETIVAGSIDGTVSIIKKTNGRYRKTKGLKIHASCIRDILIDGEKHLSLSNSGVVIMTDGTGRPTHRVDLDNISFRVNKYSIDGVNGFLVASDQGMVYLLSEALERVASIAVPALSCWNAISHNSKVIVLGGDGRIYLFGSEKSEKYQKEMEGLQDALNSEKTRTAEATKETRETSDVSTQKSEEPKYKVVDDKVYELKDGVWELFGSTVEKKKKDHTITITLGNSNYSLSFDKTDKYENVAKEFLKEHNLSTEYTGEIVEFLNKNFTRQKPKDMSKYHLYNIIDIENVKKRTQDFPNSQTVHTFIERLLSKEITVDASEHSEVEIILSEWLEKTQERIAVLDIYKYLISQGADFDLFFLKNIDVFSCKKIGLVFGMISTNIQAMRPECRRLVENTMARVIDKQWISPGVLENYKKNKKLSLEDTT